MNAGLVLTSAATDPGAYWKFNRAVKADLVDLRLQSMEVSGQEILTRDKVSLRINLTASYRVTEVLKARQDLADYSDFLYRELQFALRETIGARVLDTLLGEKGSLARLRARCATGCAQALIGAASGCKSSSHGASNSRQSGLGLDRA